MNIQPVNEPPQEIYIAGFIPRDALLIVLLKRRKIAANSSRIFQCAT